MLGAIAPDPGPRQRVDPDKLVKAVRESSLPVPPVPRTLLVDHVTHFIHQFLCLMEVNMQHRDFWSTHTARAYARHGHAAPVEGFSALSWKDARRCIGAISLPSDPATLAMNYLNNISQRPFEKIDSLDKRMRVVEYTFALPTQQASFNIFNIVENLHGPLKT